MTGGVVHLLTGDGKGKTTAAFGLCLRAAGHGLRSLVVQFLKGRPSGEVAACARFLEGLVVVERFGRESFVVGRPTEEDERLVRRGLARARAALGERWRIVVLDEVLAAAALGTVTEEELVALCDATPAGTDLVLTGRDASEALCARADLVTVCQARKHYYDGGLGAREGIEY